MKRNVPTYNELLEKVTQQENEIAKLKKAIASKPVEDMKKEKAEERENLLRRAENLSHQGSWKWDVVNDKWTFSENWMHIHGFDQSQISRKELMELAHPDDKSRIDEAFNQSLSNKKTYSLEHRIVRKDNGMVRTMVASGEVHFTDDGKPEFMIGVAQDITERKQMENDLIKNQIELNALIQNSPICTKKVDLDFNLNFMSEAGIRELKVDHIDEHYGAPYPFYFFPDDFKKEMTIKLKEAKETGKTIQLDGILSDTLGNKMWYNHVIVPVKNVEGKLDYLLVLSTDITNRKIAELKVAEYQTELEKKVDERTSELQEKMNEIERFNKLFIGREFRIKELKEKVKELENRLNKN